MSFEAVNIFKNSNPEDKRLGNLIAPTSSSADIVILGYPDDEGVKNNRGRSGAEAGPNGIRSIFYKTTPHTHIKTPNIFDQGNLSISPPLAERHQVAMENINGLLNDNKAIISLGGGHDYAYPDGAGFVKAFRKQKTKPLIINFDAHLDLRPFKDEINSGTPFYRLLSEFSDDFDFIQLGLQQVCNSKTYYDWGKARGMKSLWFEDFKASGEKLTTFFLKHFESVFIHKPLTFISLDIDVFSSAYVPGASQSWPYGLSPEDFFPLFHLLCQRLDVRLLGIYEVAPSLDENLKTQRLAAQIMHRYLYKY